MKINKLLTTLSLIYSTFSFSQSNENKLLFNNSIKDLTLLNNATAENLQLLKICNNRTDCKGFLSEKDTSKTTLDEMDVRAIITKVKEFEFKIEYKYKNSTEFIIDTFYLFCMTDSYSIALPSKSTKIELLAKKFSFEEFFPASTDEREMVFYSLINDKIVFYNKEN